MENIEEEIIKAFPGRVNLQEAIRHCRTDWGTAPRYTEEYRKIRWHGSKATYVPAQVEQVRVLSEDGTTRYEPRTIPPMISKPMWLTRLEYQLNKKRLNTWNLGTKFLGVKSDTLHLYAQDLSTAIMRSTPFKTRTTEYRPKDQWVYLYGQRALKFDLLTGTISHFTLGNVYKKEWGFILRQVFGIYVFKVRDVVYWNPTYISPESRDPTHPTHQRDISDFDKMEGAIIIDTNEIYPIRHYRQDRTSREYDKRLINYSLYVESNYSSPNFQEDPLIYEKLREKLEELLSA